MQESINLKTAKNVNQCIRYLPEKPGDPNWKEDRQTFTNMIKETQFKAKYLKTDKYFPKDTEVRDIWRITMKRNGKTISFTFGNSISDTMEGKEPDLYDVLSGIDLEYRTADYTFNEFCDEFGYDTDSIQDLRTYKQSKKLSEKFRQIFTEVESYSMPS